MTADDMQGFWELILLQVIIFVMIMNYSSLSLALLSLLDLKAENPDFNDT